jgi:hypothetical protein
MVVREMADPVLENIEPSENLLSSLEEESNDKENHQKNRNEIQSPESLKLFHGVNFMVGDIDDAKTLVRLFMVYSY